MSSKKWVGLCGAAGGGKDYTFALLRKHFPGINKIAFAAPLKSILIATDPIINPGARLSDILFEMGFERAKREHPEIRRLLQKMGTDGIRNTLGRDIFVRTAFDKGRDGLNVFTDVRFQNEANAIREEGGVIVRVTRPTASALQSEFASHSSERDSSGIHEDFEFVNDGNAKHIDALVKYVRSVVDGEDDAENEENWYVRLCATRV